MSRETDFHLRLQSQADNEIKTTAVDVFGGAAKFTSQLTSKYFRKGFFVYNNSDSASGELVWGDSTVTEADGIPVPKGAWMEIPVSTDLDIYFANVNSGEISNMRVLEIA